MELYQIGFWDKYGEKATMEQDNESLFNRRISEKSERFNVAMENPTWKYEDGGNHGRSFSV